MKNSSPYLYFATLATSMTMLLVACGNPQNTTNISDSSVDKPTQSIASVEAVEYPISDRVVSEREEAIVNGARLKASSLAPHSQRIPQKPAIESQRLAADWAFNPGYSIQHRENYQHFDDSGIHSVTQQPVSTFSIDVDTGAYANVRRFLNQGQMPHRDAVRAEELINYFNYNYDNPESRDEAFRLTTEMAPSPWNKNSQLLHIGLQSYTQQTRPASNLVFLVDVSGSMQGPNKLELLKSALQLLTRQMRTEDRISLVTYAANTGVVLEPTAGDQHATILRALQRLQAGGSTNGGSGIQLAYQMAQQGFIEQGINRIILATDGDFNVGITQFEELKQLVESRRKGGVSLTTLGFGHGNYNDHLMEQLANAGNGNYSYIDNLTEARKVLVDEMHATLNTLAYDVKVQVEFNPQQVAEYRLIGYENRALAREDFNNDKVDAGEVGEGHSVTALYEITLADAGKKQLPDLRYGNENTSRGTKHYSNELAYIKLRYKNDINNTSRQMNKVINRNDRLENVADASDNFRFAAAVAAFAQQLRGGKNLQQFTYDDTLSLARQSRGQDKEGYRSEFIQLVSLAKSLDM